MKASARHHHTANNIVKAEYHLCTGKGNLRERFAKAWGDLAIAISDQDYQDPEMDELKRYLQGHSGPQMAGVTDENLECAAKCVFELGHTVSRETGAKKK